MTHEEDIYQYDDDEPNLGITDEDPVICEEYVIFHEDDQDILETNYPSHEELSSLPETNSCHSDETGTVIGNTETITDIDLQEIHLGEKHSNGENISFTGSKYSETEINKMKENVRNYESEVNNLKNSIDSHENRVNNADTTKGHENGSYAQEISELNREKSKLNNTVSKLSEAKSKLNNAT